MLYAWSNGETDAINVVDQPGIYGLTITDSSNGCTGTTSVEVFQNPCGAEINATTSELTCLVTSITLDAIEVSGSATDLNYLWSTGNTTTSIEVNEPGEYWSFWKQVMEAAVETVHSLP